MKKDFFSAATNSDREQTAPFLCISADVRLGRGVKLSKFINLYGCTIGDNTKIGAFVEIQKNVIVGRNCKISSHTFVCEGVVVEDEVFIGHGVAFTNDIYPRATTDGKLQTEADWVVEPTLVKKGASIGSGATILPNITIGERAIVGAGSVVTADVPANAIVAGNPAKVLRYQNRDNGVPRRRLDLQGPNSRITLWQGPFMGSPGSAQIRSRPLIPVIYNAALEAKMKDGLP